MMGPPTAYPRLLPQVLSGSFRISPGSPGIISVDQGSLPGEEKEKEKTKTKTKKKKKG